MSKRTTTANDDSEIDHLASIVQQSQENELYLNPEASMLDRTLSMILAELARRGAIIAHQQEKINELTQALKFASGIQVE